MSSAYIKKTAIEFVAYYIFPPSGGSGLEIRDGGLSVFHIIDHQAYYNTANFKHIIISSLLKPNNNKILRRRR